MASSSAPGFAFQANGSENPSQAPDTGGSSRYRSDSESEIYPTAKSLSRLCSRDRDERAAALEELSQKVLVCLGLDRPGSARLSKQTLLHLLRLSRSCPLQEVRMRASELLCTAQVMLILIKKHLYLGVDGRRFCSFSVNKNVGLLLF